MFRLATVPGVDIEASDIQHVAVDDRDRIVLAGNVYDNEYVDREDYGSPFPAIRLRGSVAAMAGWDDVRRAAL